MALKGKIRGMRMRDGKSIGQRGAGRCTEVSARVGGDCLCMAADITHCRAAGAAATIESACSPYR